MAIDWDAELLAPTMAVFGEGDPANQSTWPTYYSMSGGRLPLPGAVFDRAYKQIVELADGSQGTTDHPVLGVRARVFADQRITPRQGDGVAVPSVQKTYLVTDVRPDGHGHILLILIEGSR